MNSRERVFAAVTGTTADRPAFLLNLSLYGARLSGAPLARHYADAATFAEGQIAVRERFAPDLLLSPFYFAGLGEAFGGAVAHHAGQAPTLVRPPAATVAEALALPLPDVDSHPGLTYLRDSVRILAARYGTEVPVVGVLASPVDIPTMLLGIDPWLGILLEEPEGAKALLDRCGAFFVRLGNALLGDGATLLAVTANFANPTVVPRRVATALGRPALDAAFREVAGPIVLHHGGCRLAPHVGDFLGLPNVIGVAVDTRDSLAEAREKLGEAPVLLGNLDGPALESKSPEAVNQACQAILRERAGDSHFIFASSQADIPLATPPACIEAIRDAVLECS